MNQPDIEPLAVAPADEIQRAQAQRLEKTWETPSGFRYWSSVNNSDVGLWYTGMTLLFLLFGGVLALLMRIQFAVPNNDFLSAELYNQAFTVHGSVMMFLFAIPIFEAIAVLFLPQMLGARDLPFPRLSAFGFWCFLLGGIFLLRLDLFQRRAARRLVHVPAAYFDLSTGHRRGYLAVGIFVHRNCRHCRRRRDDRRLAQNPAAGDAHQPHPALCLVRAGGGGDDRLRVSAAHCRQHAAGNRARVSLAVFQSARAAATRCCGSISSGSSVIRRSTSSFCPRSR